MTNENLSTITKGLGLTSLTSMVGFIIGYASDSVEAGIVTAIAFPVSSLICFGGIFAAARCSKKKSLLSDEENPINKYPVGIHV